MDITESVLLLAPKAKTLDYRNRLVPSEVPSSETAFISETSNLLFVLNDCSKILKEIKTETSGRVQFEHQSDRAQRLSDKLENCVKVAQIKLEEIKNVEIRTCCSSAIQEVLQKRLFLVTKDFQVTLNARTKQLRKTSEKKNKFEVVSKDQPTFLENDE